MTKHTRYTLHASLVRNDDRIFETETRPRMILQIQQKDSPRAPDIKGTAYTEKNINNIYSVYTLYSHILKDTATET